MIVKYTDDYVRGSGAGAYRRKRRRKKRKDPLKGLLLLFVVLLLILIALLVRRFIRSDHVDPKAPADGQYGGEGGNTQTENAMSGVSHSVGEKAEKSETEIRKEAKDEVFYFRKQLEPTEQLIYDALLACAESADPSILGEELSIDVNPESDEFDLIFERARCTMTADHPELFWISVSDSSFSYTYQTTPDGDGRYRLSFCFLEPLPGRKEMMEELENAADQLLEGIDLNQSAPEIALEVHDRLIELVEYDHSSVNGNQDLAHTAYGALVRNDSRKEHMAVCDGYSGAYEYLLHKAGICCLMISGRAGDDKDSAMAHSWNMVLLDGEWYETDCTWDDGEIAGDGTPIITEALSDESYLNLLRHYMFQVTTDQISDFEPGAKYRYTSDNGWVSFLNHSVHIRNTEEDSEFTGDCMTPVAPVAYGIKYSYENLR